MRKDPPDRYADKSEPRRFIWVEVTVIFDRISACNLGVINEQIKMLANRANLSKVSALIIATTLIEIRVAKKRY